MIKKFFAVISAMTLIFSVGCSNETIVENEKLQIVATLFPQYDFARQIAGDKADVTLLLPTGMDSHSYEPTPADMISVSQSDIFIYTGDNFESWAGDIISDIDGIVLDVSAGIDIDKYKDDDDDDHEHEEHSDHNHSDYDPHIWTSPVIAQQMVDNVLNTLCQADPENSEFYTQNAESYKSELAEIDSQFRTIAENADNKLMVFGGKFAMYYFVKEYDLEYISAFDSCSNETEPSPKVMNEIITRISSENISVVYYEELSDHKVADAIAEETGAETLLFHTCHNVSQQDLEDGVSYADLMRQNIKNFERGIN